MIQTVKGTRDILPADMPLWLRVEAVAREAFRRYGFDEIRTPIFEKTELFARGVGESTDIVHKEMYTFTDKDSDQTSLTLRPENTASVVRAYIQHKMYNDKASGEMTKLYYIGPMFRRERPQAGRFRQFFQIGAEVLGTSDDPAIEAEVVEMLHWMLNELKITDTTLLINSVGDSASRPAYIEKLRAAAAAVLDQFCDDCKHRYETNALRMFDCKNPKCQALIADLPTITDSLDDASRVHFEQFKAHLDARGIAYIVNPRMVRGLDYYTRTTFEIIGGSLGAQSTIVGAGRYDGLAETLDGPPTKGFGFAFGLDRMVLSIPSDEAERLRTASAPDVFIIYTSRKSAEGYGGGENYGHGAGMLISDDEVRNNAFEVARFLRKQGANVAIEFESRKLKKAMALANKSKARHVLIIGDEEVKSGFYSLKNMSTGEQESLNLESIKSKLIGG